MSTSRRAGWPVWEQGEGDKARCECSEMGSSIALPQPVCHPRPCELAASPAPACPHYTRPICAAVRNQPWLQPIWRPACAMLSPLSPACPPRPRCFIVFSFSSAPSPMAQAYPGRPPHPLEPHRLPSGSVAIAENVAMHGRPDPGPFPLHPAPQHAPTPAPANTWCLLLRAQLQEPHIYTTTISPPPLPPHTPRRGRRKRNLRAKGSCLPPARPLAAPPAALCFWVDSRHGASIRHAPGLIQPRHGLPLQHPADPHFPHAPSKSSARPTGGDAAGGCCLGRWRKSLFECIRTCLPTCTLACSLPRVRWIGLNLAPGATMRDRATL